jgi:hypothetical protein
MLHKTEEETLAFKLLLNKKEAEINAIREERAQAIALSEELMIRSETQETAWQSTLQHKQNSQN